MQPDTHTDTWDTFLREIYASAHYQFKRTSLSAVIRIQIEILMGLRKSESGRELENV